MNYKTQEALKKFADVDTWHTPHPMDEERFFDFIISAFKNNDQVTSSEFRSFFSSDEDLAEKVSMLFFQYENGVTLLKRFNSQ